MDKIKLFILLLSFSSLFGGMINPANEKSLSYTHVLFEWDQTEDAISYEIEISENSSFNPILVTGNSESLIYLNTEDINWENTYYWRVCPIYSDLSIGTCLDSFSFTTLSPITTVKNLTPADITLHNEDLYQDGVTFLGSYENHFSAAFDKAGDEIWNTQNNNIIMYNTNMMGELYGCYYQPGLEHEYPPIEFDLDANFVWEGPNDEGSDHDLIRLPDGNYMSIVDSYQNIQIPQGTPFYSDCQYVGGYPAVVCNSFPWKADKIEIWDKDTGETLWEWESFDYYSTLDYDGVHINTDTDGCEFGIYGGTWIGAWVGHNSGYYDWIHFNAVTYIEDENAIYVSSRHLSRITKINFNINNYNDPTNGDIIWNMGQDMPSGDVNCGDNLKFSFQHNVSVLHNGNIVILDNGNLSECFNEEGYNITRALEINPNEIENGCNAEIVWEYSLPPDLFGIASGGVQKLANGNYLITTTGNEGATIEVSSEGELVWDASYNLDLPFIQRGYRVSGLYPVEVSVIASNYTEINGESGVYVPESNGHFEFTIFNNGSSDEDFEYTLSGDWYDGVSGTVTIPSGDSVTKNIPGDINPGENFSEAVLSISSLNNKNISKNYAYEVYASNALSNEIEIVNDFSIIDVYPNPFNPSTIIYINLNKIVEDAYLSIYDINGRIIDRLFNGDLSSGEHQINWTPKNLSSGKYFIQLTSKEINLVREVVYIK